MGAARFELAGRLLGHLFDWIINAHLALPSYEYCTMMVSTNSKLNTVQPLNNI